MLIPYRSLAS